MKNWADVKTTLKFELNNWFRQQAKHPYCAYYLYYYPTTPETDGGLLITKDAPIHGNTGEPYRLVMAQPINKGATVEQNLNWILLSRFLNRLPILSIN